MENGVAREFRHISGKEIHLWTTELSAFPGEEGLLNIRELERAGRYKFHKDAQNFIAGRAFLRKVLSRYTGIPPHELEIVNSKTGKPRLAGGNLKFNMSHSGDFCLLALAGKREIGCDLEKAGSDAFLLEMELQFFSEKEKTWLRRLDPSRAQEYSCRAWTLKEAYLKAIGQGLLLALDTFTLIPEEDGQGRLESPLDFRSWECRHFALKDGYFASICVEKGFEGLEIKKFDQMETAVAR